ncbi:unnamed protein product [Cochlearia groenlandica]
MVKASMIISNHLPETGEPSRNNPPEILDTVMVPASQRLGPLFDDPEESASDRLPISQRLGPFYDDSLETT